MSWFTTITQVYSFARRPSPASIGSCRARIDRTKSPPTRELYEVFRRVHVRPMGDVDDGTLANRLLNERQVLCIVNTRYHAVSLYNCIRGNGAYHLSARMYPAHRSGRFKAFREALKRGETCRVVATQLIEAGVDIDFRLSTVQSPASTRSLRLRVAVTERAGYLLETFSYFGQRCGISPAAGFSALPQSRRWSFEAMTIFCHWKPSIRIFALLYEFEGSRLDEHHIVDLFNQGAKQLAFPFRQVGEAFQLIDSPMVSVVIPREQECVKTLEEAMYQGPSLGLSRASTVCRSGIPARILGAFSL